MGRLVDRLLNIVLVAAAVLLVLAFVQRTTIRDTKADLRGPELREDWRDLTASGRWIGNPSAPVTIIEFGDYECSFCRRFALDIKRLLLEYPDSVAISYIHYPLDTHRFAIPASLAAECAGDQRSFEAYHDLLYQYQDSIGLKSWTSFAQSAGVPDVEEFESCIAENTHRAAILRTRAIGDSIGVKGTPAVLINGWFYSAGIDTHTLENAVRSLVGGTSWPVDER